MFSKQLEYSYLMYEYIKSNSQEYILGKEIVERTNVPKSWGIELLYNMVKTNLLETVKGKGFRHVKQELNFWEFYLKVEEFKSNSEISFDKNIVSKEMSYMDIVKNIGFTFQEEMKKIRM